MYKRYKEHISIFIFECLGAVLVDVKVLCFLSALLKKNTSFNIYVLDTFQG